MLFWFTDLMNVTEEVTIHLTPDEGIRQDYRNVGSMNCDFFDYIH